MLKLVIIVSSLAFAFVDSAVAQGADLSGQWTVTWDNNSQNAMSLALTGGRFSGNYINEREDRAGVPPRPTKCSVIEYIRQP
jgi:hypothetical protein